MKEKCLILKPDKGQGIVLIDKTDYSQTLIETKTSTTIKIEKLLGKFFHI